jgi:acyl carrier protein
MSISSTIIDQFMRTAREHGLDLPALDDDTLLIDSGLDSLCFAVVVTRLEEIFKFDPFSSEGTLFPMTFGEFVGLYEACETVVE